MNKFNWEGKTGITETQWLQVISGVLCLIAYYSGYEVIATHAAIISQVLLGGIGKLLRSRQKVVLQYAVSAVNGDGEPIPNEKLKASVMGMVEREGVVYKSLTDAIQNASKEKDSKNAD